MDITIHGETWLPTDKLGDAVGVQRLTVYAWIKAGAIPTIKRGRRQIMYAPLAEAIRLRLTPVKESLEAGVYRQPAEMRAAAREAKESCQRDTRAVATSNGDEWDSYDIAYVVEAYDRGDYIRDIAKHVGRTYTATCIRIGKLREAGDIDGRRRPLDDQAWLPSALARLQATEVAELINERRAA